MKLFHTCSLPYTVRSHCGFIAVRSPLPLIERADCVKEDVMIHDACFPRWARNKAASDSILLRKLGGLGLDAGSAAQCPKGNFKSLRCRSRPKSRCEEQHGQAPTWPKYPPLGVISAAGIQSERIISGSSLPRPSPRAAQDRGSPAWWG